jgi:hypothetical protein
MDLPRLLTDFQVRFGDKLAELTQFLGSDYANWDHFSISLLSFSQDFSISRQYYFNFNEKPFE